MLLACVACIRCVRTRRWGGGGPILERERERLSKKVEPSSGHARPRIGAIAALRRQDRNARNACIRQVDYPRSISRYAGWKVSVFLYHKCFKVTQNLLQLAIIVDRAFPRHVIIAINSNDRVIINDVSGFCFSALVDQT